VPRAGAALAREIARFVQALRRRRLAKVPGVAETIDWTQALVRLGRERLDEESAAETIGCLVKDRHDWAELSRETVAPMVAAAREDPPP
jgi:MoxR-like ATPase